MRKITIHHAEVTGKCKTSFGGADLAVTILDGDLVVSKIELGEDVGHARFAKGTWIYYVLGGPPKVE